MEIRKAQSKWRRMLLRGIVRLIYGIRLILRPFKARRPNAVPARIAMFASMEFLGGGIVISGMAKLLKQVYPNARIYVVGEQHRSGKLESFFRDHSWVDELIVCPVRGGSSLVDWVRFYKSLKGCKLDMCILPPSHSCANSVFLYLCGIPEIVGVDLPGTWIENRFLDRRLTAEVLGDSYRLLKFPEAYGKLLTGRKDFSFAEVVPFLHFQDRGLVEQRGPRITLHPGGASQTARWPWERYAELGRMLVDRYGATLYIIGGEEERDLAQRIKQSIDRKYSGGLVLNCCGCSLNDTLNYVGHSQVYVGNNGGTLLIPVALGVPVVGVFLERERWFSGPDALSEDHCVVSRGSIEDIPVIEVWNAIDLRWADRLSAQSARLNVTVGQ